MEPVIWGVLSVSGHYALRIHAPISKSPLLEMRAIASRSQQKADAAAGKLGIKRAYGSYEQLLADREIEAVYIPLPNHLHAEWVKKAADAGKHILCEKPFAMNAKEAEDAILYAQRKGMRIMEAFMYRFHPMWQRAREIVRSGELGEVQSIHTIFTYSQHDPKNIRNIVEVGGGGMYDIGCYAVSSARFLLQAEPDRVICLVHRDPSLKTDVLSSAMLDFGKTRSLFTVATQAHDAQSVQVFGSNGSLMLPTCFNIFPDIPAQFSVTGALAPRTINTTAVDQYALLFEGFSKAIRGEGEPLPITPQDSIANMRVLDALFRSEKSGRWESVLKAS
jgi:predicted dehydrogenase